MKPIHLISYPLGNSVTAFTTTRKGGVSIEPYHELNMALHVNDNPEHVRQNRNLLANYLNIKLAKFQFADQTHSAHCAFVEEVNPIPVFNTDALFSNQKGICLCIQTADCVPVLLYDDQSQAIAAVHAGWRGTATNITGTTVQKMRLQTGSNSANLKAVIGPCITQPFYEVNHEVYAAFMGTDSELSMAFSPSNKAGHYMLDLKLANKLQLIKAGVMEQNIVISPYCTFSDPELFFSARKSGYNTGRMITGIVIR